MTEFENDLYSCNENLAGLNADSMQRIEREWSWRTSGTIRGTRIETAIRHERDRLRDRRENRWIAGCLLAAIILVILWCVVTPDSSLLPQGGR